MGARPPPLTAGSPGYDPDPEQRALRRFGADRESQWEYWVAAKDPRLEFRNCGVYGQRTDEIAAGSMRALRTRMP
jgi:hypothetical protein